MQKPKELLVVILLVVLVVLTLPARPTLAQASLEPGIDLVILIDQSNSMFGVTSTGTDRDGRRVSTAQYLIDYLAFDSTYVNPNRDNRVLVIAFGSYGREEIVVPLMSLNSESDVEAAKALVEPLRRPQQSLNGTDFISALELVSQQFPPVSEDPDLAQNLRRRLIVVITDGGPDLRGTVYDDNAEYFSSLGQIYEEQLGRDHYPVYVIGIDKNEPPIYWNNVEELWVDNVTGEGYAARVTDPSEINKQIVKMLCPFLNSSGEGACQLQEIGDHFILPYARSVSFSFFKYDPHAQIELYRPEGTGETGGPEVLRGDPDVLEYKRTPSDEFFGLSFPQPGCWRSERLGAGKVDVLAQVVFNDMVMTKPASAHPLVSPLSFEFTLKDSSGNPIDEIPNFPVELNAQLMGPNGSRSIPIDKVQPGLYASTLEALTTEEGFYTLSLSGDTTISSLDECLESVQTFTIFSQTFEIPVYKPSIALVEPDSLYYNYRPLTGLAVQFIGRDGLPLVQPIDDRYEVEMTLESPSGKVIGVDDVQLDGNTFRSGASIFLPEAGNYDLRLVLRDTDDQSVVFDETISLEVSNAVVVLQPGPNHPAFAPVNSVAVELQDNAGNQLPYDADYPLDVVATLVKPDGSSSEATLSSVGANNHYVTSVDWELTQSAPYTLEVGGYTSALPGMPMEPVFIARETIVVSEYLPFFVVNKPTDSNHPLHWWYLPPLDADFTFKPQSIVVELRHKEGMADASEFFTNDVDTLFSVTLRGPNNDIVAEDVPLRTTDGTNFSVDLPGLEESGVYTATVSLSGQLRGDILTTGAWPDVTVAFSRRDSLLYNGIWAFLTLVAGGSVLYFGGSFVLNRFFLPKAKGKLVAETRGPDGEYLQEFPITRKQLHHVKFKEREIDPILGLSRIDIWWAQPQENSKGEVKAQRIRVRAYNKDGLTVVNSQVVKAGRTAKVTSQKTVPSDGNDQPQSYQFRYED